MPVGVKGFQKGHRLNLGNKYASNRKWTPEQLEEKRLAMLGNTQGFKKGKPSWNNGTNGLMNTWNKGKKMPEFSRENHPRWRGGIKLRGKDTLSTPEYYAWRNSVLERDNWRCQMEDLKCSGGLEIHHILPWRDYPELRYEVKNGITLCHYHHPRKRKEESKLVPTFTKIINSTAPHSI